MSDFLTIGIPVWNDPESIKKSVRAIVKSSAWRERSKDRKELVICVNGVGTSNNLTLKAARELQQRIPQLRVITLKARGKNVAMNHIAQQANPRSKFVFFCDADVLVKKDTISRLVNALRENPSAKFAGAAAVPATSLVPEEKRSSLKSYFLERTKKRLDAGPQFVSGAAYVVNKNFFLKNPLPNTNDIADDLFINEHFRGRIILVRSARVFYLLPSTKERVLQRARYIVQEREQGVKKPKPSSLVESELSVKAKRGAKINQLINRLAATLVKVHPKIGWRNLGSTKLRKRH